MGRKRLPDEEKKVGIKLSITKRLYDDLKERNVNVSKIFEEFLLEKFEKK